MPISATDRDMMIRTVIGEADDQPPIGQAAVAHTILNRLADGRWGDTPSQVVLSRGQFEPWQTRAAELTRIKTDSPRYQRSAAIVDAVLRGEVPDPTSGATHFLQPDIVMKRRGGSLPDWASGPGLKIGDHAFYRPAEMGPAGVGKQDDDLISEWLTGTPKEAAGKPSISEPRDEDLVSEWLPKDAPAPAKTVPAKAETASADEPDFINRLARGAHGHGDPNITSLVTGQRPDSWGDTAVRSGAGIMRGALDPGETLGRGIAYAGEAGAEKLSKLGIISPESAKSVSDWRAGIEENLARQNEDFDKYAGTAGQLGRVGGQILATSPILKGAGALVAGTRAIPGVTSIVNTASKVPGLVPAIRGGTTGATFNALTSSARPDVPVSEQIKSGAVLGAPLGIAGHVVGKLFPRLDRDTAALAKTALDKYGIPIRADQLSSNPMVRFMGSVMQRLPFTGLGTHAAEQQGALQRALANEMGVASDKITPDVVKAAQRTAYNAYDAAKARMGTLNVDTRFYRDLADVYRNAQYNLEAPQAKLINKHLENIMDKISPSGRTLDPDLYQSLTRKSGPLDNAINSKDSKIATYAGDIKNALENLVGRNDPALKALKDAADYKYFVAKAVEPLADEATTGNISPAKLLKAVDYSHTDAGELGRIARRFMVEPPSSGTAERLASMKFGLGLLGGAAGLGGAYHFDPENFQRDAAVLGATLLAARGGGSLLKGRPLGIPLNKLMIRSGLRTSPGGVQEFLTSKLPLFAPRQNPLLAAPAGTQGQP